MTVLLEARDLAITFGGIKAIAGVSLSVRRGDLLGLIGPNGAGKTTFLRLLTGILHPQGGSVSLGGRDVTRLPVDRRGRAGLAMTHQIVRPFRRMSAADNVALAAGHAITGSPFRALIHLGRARARRRALELLDRVGLADVADRLAGTLALGQLKRLEMARALAIDPSIVLLDEPLAGLNQVEATRLGDTISWLNRQGLTIVLVEHRLAEVMRICGRLAVLDGGRLLADGPPGEVMARPKVRTTYLGAP